MATSSLARPGPLQGAAPPRGGTLALAAAGLAAAALVVLPRVPGAVGVRATAVAVAFVALVAEALPFLLFGAAISALLEGRAGAAIARASVRHPRLAVVLAPFSGAVLPLCDCGIVPLARRLRLDGTPGAAVNGFVAGAPLSNPVVILSTLVAFQGRMGMVAGRLVVGLAVAMLVAALAPIPHCRVPAHRERERHDHGGRFASSVAGELSGTGPTLILGALAAAVVKGLLPAAAFTALSSQPLLAALVLMALAFLMSICSQADAFVAASLPVGDLPRLAFLVLGPVLDLRLAALYRREFGLRWVLGYAAVVVPAVFALATVWNVWGPR